jgi:hypothetical protein
MPCVQSVRANARGGGGGGSLTLPQRSRVPPLDLIDDFVRAPPQQQPQQQQQQQQPPRSDSRSPGPEVAVLVQGIIPQQHPLSAGGVAAVVVPRGRAPASAVVVARTRPLSSGAASLLLPAVLSPPSLSRLTLSVEGVPPASPSLHVAGGAWLPRGGVWCKKGRGSGVGTAAAAAVTGGQRRLGSPLLSRGAAAVDHVGGWDAEWPVVGHGPHLDVCGVAPSLLAAEGKRGAAGARPAAVDVRAILPSTEPPGARASPFVVHSPFRSSEGPAPVWRGRRRLLAHARAAAASPQLQQQQEPVGLSSSSTSLAGATWQPGGVLIASPIVARLAGGADEAAAARRQRGRPRANTLPLHGTLEGMGGVEAAAAAAPAATAGDDEHDGGPRRDSGQPTD